MVEKERSMWHAIVLASMVAAEPTRPNVVVILADDLGYSDLGCYGGEIDTPNLDRLAANGLRYTQFYNTSRCWPTRAALLSGYYPQQIRMDPPVARLPPWVKLLPHHLKSAGYRCYHSGKWHVSGAPAVIKDGGFDRSMEIRDWDRNFNPRQGNEDDRPIPNLPPNSPYYSTTAVVDHAVKCLKGHRTTHSTSPFFSYVAFTAPHFPLQAPAEDVAKYRERYAAGWWTLLGRRIERQSQLGIIPQPPNPPDDARIKAPGDLTKAKAGLGSDAEKEVFEACAWDELSPAQKAFQADKLTVHAAMVDRMDREIGRLLDQLKAMNAFENTLILFLADNGASAEILVRGDGHDPDAQLGSAGTFLCLGPGGATVANAPFRRYKMWTHEGGICTPMIAHWPRRIDARGELRRTVGHVIDLAPTIAELAGVDLRKTTDPNAPPRPGRSLAGSFSDDQMEERELFFHHSGNRALRVGDWKLVSAKDTGNAWELFNLADDRTERTNLAKANPERVLEMAARWNALDAEYRKQGYGDLPPEALPTGKKKTKAP
jgi:arylsulfatase A-like enzyme